VRAFRLIAVLYRIGLLSPLAIARLFLAIYRRGINLMALLNFAARAYGDRIALADASGKPSYTYRQLCEESERLAVALRQEYGIGKGKKVGLMCKNHAAMVKTIYAVSATGADLVLLNAEMGDSRWNALSERQSFDLLVHDEEHAPMLRSSSYPGPALPCDHPDGPSINGLISTGSPGRPRGSLGRSSAGKLVLLTGGTTGQPKEAAHKPSLFDYLNPFSDFLGRLRIVKYKTAYIATPIYHGYGIAVLLLVCALGKKAVISPGFDAGQACRLVREHRAEIVTVVPLMLRKMLLADKGGELRSLACIASGGAELSPKLVRETRERAGEALYNLYGTSEAGLNLIATPEDLAYSPNTIGRPIRGVRLRILDERGKEAPAGRVGRICVRNRWSAKTGAPGWIETGDLGYRDERGYYFLRGRTDSMIVSAGENVYPLEVEQVLLAHPLVEDAAVIGVRDEHFGQRLKAFVEKMPAGGMADGKAADADRPNGGLTEAELRAWLRERLARFQMPGEIVFVDRLPYTALGKPDKMRLAEMG